VGPTTDPGTLRPSNGLAAITVVRTESFCAAEVITVPRHLGEVAPVPASRSWKGRDLLGPQ
jgi:hypothetical protein